MKCNLKVLKDKNVLGIFVCGIIVVLVLVFCILMTFKSRVNIASVDLSKIINEHPAMEEAMKNFQKELDNQQKKYDKLKDEEKAKEQQKIQQEMTQLAIQMQQNVVKTAIGDVERIAKKNGYNYVIDKNALIVGGKDITDEVLKELKQNKQEKVQNKENTSDIPIIPVNP